jgi:RNA polymerase sigma-70 factor (ECF subfamily)
MRMSVSESAERLAAARAGSAEALGEALEACRAYLLVVAGRELDGGLRAKGGASDVVQQTFLEAQRDFDGFRGTSEQELLHWLSRLLLNNVANFVRHYRATAKRKVGREVELKADTSSLDWAASLAADTPSPSGQAMAHEQTEALERALERLPEDYRRIIVLRNREDRSFEEIAQFMERSENAVRKLWFRAIQTLRQAMETTS